MSNDMDLVYTIQFTEDEFDQLVGDLYYYFRHLKDKALERNSDVEDETTTYFTNNLEKVLELQSKLESVSNKANENNPLYVLKDIEVTNAT